METHDMLSSLCRLICRISEIQMAACTRAACHGRLLERRTSWAAQRRSKLLDLARPHQEGLVSSLCSETGTAQVLGDLMVLLTIVASLLFACVLLPRVQSKYKLAPNELRSGVLQNRFRSLQCVWMCCTLASTEKIVTLLCTYECRLRRMCVGC